MERPEESCSRCEKVLDTEGSPRWCKACRAKYQREYQHLVKDMKESRGFAAGVSAMREYLVANFAQYGTSGSFTGVEIASVIQRVKGPVAG